MWLVVVSSEFHDQTECGLRKVKYSCPITMPQNRYWNLSQTAVWVEYRSNELVNQFECDSRNAYVALASYPTMHEYKRVARLSEVGDALTNGYIPAWGCPADKPDSYEVIPAIEWTNLTLRPPIAFRTGKHNARVEPWTDVRFESRGVLQLWPSTFQQDARVKYRWDKIEAIYRKMKDSNPDYSQNELIEEIAEEFQGRYKQDPPGRTTIQRHMKKWT